MTPLILVAAIGWTGFVLCGLTVLLRPRGPLFIRTEVWLSKLAQDRMLQDLARAGVDPQRVVFLPPGTEFLEDGRRRSSVPPGASPCPGCGVPRNEVRDSATGRSWWDRCLACEAKATAREVRAS